MEKEIPISEIFRRVERNITLFGVSDSQLKKARAQATREIHRCAIDREIQYRKKWAKKKPTTTSGITHVRRKGRCPTKKALR